MRQADAIVMISTELARQFDGTLPADAIARAVADAVHDLRGSIAVEALPEMAVRLARVRLAHRAAGPARPLVAAGPAHPRPW